MKKGLIIFATICAIITGITFVSCSNMLEDLRNAGKKITLVSGYKGETIEFGSWPQSEAEDITASNLTATGKKYDGENEEYKDAENNYYVKVEYKYYKVEPITWRIIAYYSDGSKLLLADKIYSRIPYYGTTSNRDLSGTTIYPNNYKYSNIRAYLNSTRNQFEIDGGSPAEYDVDWAGKGFLTSAFTGDELEKIKTTAVDNSAASTGLDPNEFACENTEDKVYLLSYKEATNPRYGLSDNKDRIMQTTAYARANGAYQSKTEGDGGYWWLRSPYYGDYARRLDYSDYACRLDYDGDEYDYHVDCSYVGVVPALTVKNLYTVTFDTDGGNIVPLQTVSKGEKAHKPDDPTKTDAENNLYEFLGWYNGKKKYDFSADVNKDITLKAKWDKIALVSGYKGETIEFGNWPQSEFDVTGIDLKETEKTYDKHETYSDDDGNYYVKVSDKHYKVEPIEWRVIATYSDGRKLLLADKIYTNIAYYESFSKRVLKNGKTIFPNNYKYSNIRAYLNSTKNQFEIDGGRPTEEIDVDWTGKGFLTSAFTSDELKSIKPTKVDNSAATTDNDKNPYECDNTEDKIFLLSYKEAQKQLYDFNNENLEDTAYAIANGAYIGGEWWLRSPYYDNSDGDGVHSIVDDGHISVDNVYYNYGGVVPAMVVDLQENTSQSYSVGDVLLSNGKIVRYDAENLSFTEQQKAKAVGVLYGIDEEGKPRGWLGIHNSADGPKSGTYEWAKKETTGFNTYFSGIVCTLSTSGTADTVTFTGNTDGRKNWEYICFVDPVGTADAAKNYPAFNYVNSYATTFGLTGKYVDGWYMPSLAELCYIYRSKEVLNAVLGALGGTQLDSGRYWSSSQPNLDYSAWLVYFASGGVYGSSKLNDRRVCVVRAFN